jgi:hypothetical protein
MRAVARGTITGVGAVIVLGAAGLVGLAAQAIGQPANHPQVEIAHSAVARLDAGALPAEVVPGTHVDIATSTDPFVIITDTRGTVLASSASLAGETVLPPPGVFDSVRINGEDRITWQPSAGVRAWIVVDSYRGGYVVAGRSPRSAEQSAYIALLWGSIASLALAGVAGLALLVRSR